MPKNRPFLTDPIPEPLRIAWLIELLWSMDIPATRTDVTKRENVAWLLRNIQVRNSKHKDIREAIAALHVQRKHLTKRSNA